MTPHRRRATWGAALLGVGIIGAVALHDVVPHETAHAALAQVFRTVNLDPGEGAQLQCRGGDLGPLVPVPPPPRRDQTRAQVVCHALGAAPFTNASGTATDPTTVTLTVQLPDGTETAYTYAAAELTKESGQTGRFYLDYTWTVSGLHRFELRGTGTVVAVVEFGVWVRESEVG